MEEQDLMLQDKEQERFYAKWLWVLFWVHMASIALSVVTSSNELVASTMSMVVYFLYGKLGAKEDRFRMAAIFGWATLIVDIGSGLLGWEWLVLPAAVGSCVLSLLSKYHLLKGFADILRERNLELSMKWEKLWGWMCFYQAALLVLALPIAALVLAGQLWAVVVMLALCVVVITVAIRELVLLYRTAQGFRAAVQG